MKRRIIRIDQEKCNGCGACAAACHEGAIGIVEGKAVLIRDDYCDGLGDCLPACPAEAISFEEREAAAYDEEVVKRKKLEEETPTLACGCPGTQSRSIRREPGRSGNPVRDWAGGEAPSMLSQWPVQIKLAPVKAPWYSGANLLVAADCAAYAYGDFHNRFIRNRVTLIGCPKLDMEDYAEKLGAILANNDIRSLTIVRMEVPCCGGLELAARKALQESGKFIPWQVVTVATDGRIVE